MIYSKYSTYAQEAREQIDGSILKEFFVACFVRMNTGLRPLCNNEVMRPFSDRVYLSRLSIFINTLKECFFVVFFL